MGFPGPDFHEGHTSSFLIVEVPIPCSNTNDLHNRQHGSKDFNSNQVFTCDKVSFKV